MLSTIRRMLILIVVLTLFGCSQEEPVKLGFIGGISGRVADLGTAGRNGFTLAVEEQNALGGINGRKIETYYKDDQQQPQLAQAMVDELISAQVDAIIGPMTSAMAVATVDQINRAQLLMMACTVTTDQLSKQDDWFMRPLSAISKHSGKMAQYLARHEPQATKAVAILDFGNQAYTENWLEGFAKAFAQNKGQVIAVEHYISNNETNFIGVAKSALQHNPSLILLSMNSVDAAIFAKEIRRAHPDVVIAASEWAGTERLIELGGEYVEQMYVPQYINRVSQEKRFIKFKDKYQQRFKSSPGFPALFCYEATRMVIQGLSKNSQNLKQSLLNIKTFSGIQGPLVLDNFGDGKSDTFITRVQEKQFVVLE